MLVKSMLKEHLDNLKNRIQKYCKNERFFKYKDRIVKFKQIILQLDISLCPFLDKCKFLLS